MTHEPTGPVVPVRLHAVVFDAASPATLARFWARALGWDVRELDDGDALLVPTDGVTIFSILLRQVDAAKVGQNRIHFDLTTASPDDQDGTVAELLDLGGSHLDIGQGPDEDHVVLADPEGNELCVLAPGSQFLASCPRLGAVNCDGTHALGVFYSQVLDWPLVWDEGEETAVQAPDGTGPKITWSGPPLLPVPPKERLHLHLVPSPGISEAAALQHLGSHGATPIDPARSTHRCAGVIALADVDGNEICLVTS